ncbi:MAG: hypothetical protein NT106_09545 [Candidatus Sumerlaeota bacterium]|nr:hypothetical protein [Candidatus Sumerlaeota bacterium]
MIKINLLPPEMTKFKKESAKIFKVPSDATPIVILVLIIVYIGVFSVVYFVVHKKLKDDRDLITLQTERDNLKKNVESKQAQFKDLIGLRTILASQMEILKALDPPNRLLWAEKINMLAEIVPPGVYITNMDVSEDVREEETQDSMKIREVWIKGGKKGAEPPMITKPIVTQTLAIEGITWADEADQRIQLIMKFHDAMRNYSKQGTNGSTRKFMDNFQDIRIDATYLDRVGGRNVNHFKLILTSKPLVALEKK